MVTMRIRRLGVLVPILTAAMLSGTMLPGSPVTGAATAAPAPVARPTTPADVAPLLAKRLQNPRLGKAVGIVVVDAATGAVVFDSAGSSAKLPASNMKIATAVAVLATMGEAARFTTAVRSGATPSDLVLEGGGDPLLTTADLDDLAADTAARLPAGSRVVVHVDDDRFPDTKRGPGWTSGYIPYVAAPVEALARLGDYSADPSANAARVFVKALRANGVKAKLGTDADSGTDTIARVDDHTVGDAVAVMLSRSENNVAEVLYRQVAAASGVEATWRGARTAVERALSSLGVDATGMRILDGSGLSRKDRVTPRFLTDVLRVARVSKPDTFAAMFRRNALPVAGRTGTLAQGYGRYSTRPSRCARGDVQAKTGTLFDTISLSGLAETVDGDELVFSILVNERPQRFSALSTRQAVDGLAATMTGCWD